MTMYRPLWVQKLTDKKLIELLEKIDNLRNTGVTDDEELINLSDTWYDNKVGIDRFMLLSIDVWREAALRFYTGSGVR